MAQEIRTDFWGRPAFARGEYHLTFVEDEGLARRLARELKAVGREAGLTWPEFKRDPFGFVGRSVEAYGRAIFGGTSKRINFKGVLTLNPARDADDSRVDWSVAETVKVVSPLPLVQPGTAEAEGVRAEGAVTPLPTPN